MKVRRLLKKDYADWERLRSALWPDAPSEDLEVEMIEIRERPEETPVFVAERPEGGLCGLLEVSIRTEAEGCTSRKIGYLEGWFVDPSWRRRGIGRLLVEAAEAWALEQGCTEMASDTTLNYPLSPSAHAHLGYKEVNRTIHFCKVIA